MPVKLRVLSTCGGCAFCLALDGKGWACFHPRVHTQPLARRAVDYNRAPPDVCPLTPVLMPFEDDGTLAGWKPR